MPIIRNLNLISVQSWTYLTISGRFEGILGSFAFTMSKQESWLVQILLICHRSASDGCEIYISSRNLSSDSSLQTQIVHFLCHSIDLFVKL